MRLAKRSKQFPYLTEYIQYAVDWRPRPLLTELTPRSIGIGVGLVSVVGFFALRWAHGTGEWLTAGLTTGAACLAYILGIYAIAETRRAKDKDPLVELRREAK